MSEIKTEPCQTCGGGGFDGNGTGYNNVCDACAGKGELPTGTQVIEPVTELKIISNTHKFEWNFADVKKTIEGNIQKYVGLVVIEDNLKDMETAQKEIASIRTKVDGFRKAVKKKMEEPYKLFEGEIKELLQLIEKAEAPLKNQTLQYEKDRIIAKEAELNKFANTTATNMGVRPEYFKIIIPSQWTNRTAKDPAVRKEIVAQIEAMLDSQRRDDEAKEMEKQRIGLIEGQCQVHSANLKTPVVSEDVNHLLVGVTLSDIPGIILAECQKRAEMERKAAEPVVEILPPQPDHVHHPEDNSIGFPNYGEPCAEWVSEPMYPHDLNNEVPPPYQPVSMPPLPPMPPTPRELAAFVEVRTQPVPYPTQPPQPRVFKCVIEYPNITAIEGTAIKEFLSSRGISYKIISQEELRSDF